MKMTKKLKQMEIKEQKKLMKEISFVIIAFILVIILIMFL